FLDEIGELPLALQAKFLHFLENGAYRPVGSEHSASADVRVIAATNRDLAEEVRLGNFREDLFY
ncbi:MAG TPA: sigma-54-dependent Fis family transcriptional regulator, partial [Thalassospira sp.]|nr:sigma-54-dependent Fis family transcriptional regulator [Thalassospira sp.]